MQSTMYVKLEGGATVDDVRKALEERYAGEPFVRVLPKGVVPHTRHVRGSNFALINVFPDRIAGRAIVVRGGAARGSDRGWGGGAGAR
jgi:N-acetyl-gamma-glutamyl-phosphate reductase